MAALGLETLEDRTTPSVAANDLFVSSLYQTLLGRPADAGGRAYWTARLNTGATRTQVAQGIADSDEALSHDVQLFYQALLGRPAEAAGLAYWTAQLKSGASLDRVKAGILGADEFFTKAGGTAQGYLDSLYRRELGRPIEPSGLTYWEDQLNRKVSRTDVAAGVLASGEAVHETVTNLYTDILGRPADAAGVHWWSAQMQYGAGETQVLAGLFGSNEYFARVTSAALLTPSTDPSGAASTLFAAADPLPGVEYFVQRATGAAPPPTLPPIHVPTYIGLYSPPIQAPSAGTGTLPATPAPAASLGVTRPSPTRTSPTSAPAVTKAPAPAVTSPATAVASGTPASGPSGSGTNAADTNAPAGVDPGESTALFDAASIGVPPPAWVASDPAWQDSGAYTALMNVLANAQSQTPWYASDPYWPGNTNNIDPSA
jgi:hypothetical protein